MKQLFTSLLSLSLLFSSSVFSATSSDSTPNLDKIQERGTLKVGLSTFVPWAMRDKQGELIGFEVDVAKRLAKDSGLKIEFIPTAWDGIIPSLISGKFDVIIGGLTVTDDRSKSVLFTVPYSHSGVQVAANKQLTEGFTREQFNSRRVKFAARRGSITVAAIKEHFPKAKVLQFDDDAQAFQEVLNGNAHAVAASTPKPEFDSIKHADILYLPFKERLSQGNEAFAVRLGEDDKKAYFDAWIQARTADGWLKERYDYWFTSLDWQTQTAN